MKIALSMFAFALLGGCAHLQPRDTSVFSAGGHGPDWFLTMNASQIRLSVGHAERHQVSPLEVSTFPSVAPVRSGDSYTWASTNGARRIVIESHQAREAPCAAPGSGGPDTVRVQLGGREFEGCGGTQILVRGD